jgi:zinc transporter ZupT
LKFIKISLIVSHSLLLLDALDVDVIVEEETAYLDDGTPHYEKSQDPPPNMPVVDRAVVVDIFHSQSTALTNPRCADDACTGKDCPDNTIPQAASHKVPKKKKPINWKLAISLILGDAFHNFADGIFLGNAFLLCSRQVAYAIVGATIYHELAQELADYFLLTTYCGLKPLQALVLNFISGWSVLLGVLVIFALPVDANATGIILSISAGVYVYIAASECLPRVEEEVKNLCDRFSSMLCFVLGAVPIGLVLLSHGHCNA